MICGVRDGVHPFRYPIGVTLRMAEVKEDGARTGSQGDRQGRPYQKTVPFNPFACSGTGDPGGRPAGRLSACNHSLNVTPMGPASARPYADWLVKRMGPHTV